MKAITNLKTANLLSPHGIYHADPVVLMELLKPTRYYKMKTKKLQALVKLIVEEYHGNLELMFHEELSRLREKL